MKYEKKEVSLKFREFMKRHADKLWLKDFYCGAKTE